MKCNPSKKQDRYIEQFNAYSIWLWHIIIIQTGIRPVKHAPGTSTQMTLGGTPQAREIALTVPRGDKGETGNLPNIYPTTTLDAPNVHIASDGTFKRSNDTNNAASRKVGTAQGNLAERNALGRVVGVEAIGVGQTWQDVTASRVVNTTYTNSTAKPIMIYVYFGLTTTGSAFLVDGVATMSSSASAGTSGQVIVPVGSTYKSQSSFTTWTELR